MVADHMLELGRSVLAAGEEFGRRPDLWSWPRRTGSWGRVRSATELLELAPAKRQSLTNRVTDPTLATDTSRRLLVVQLPRIASEISKMMPTTTTTTSITKGDLKSLTVAAQ